MRYTEEDFTVDHVFDLIRLVTSSIFLAPFRLIGTISSKVIYIGEDALQGVIKFAIGVDIVTIAMISGYQIFFSKFSLISGRLSILDCLVSLAVLAVMYIVSTMFVGKHSLEDFKGEVDIKPDKEETKVTFTDEDIIQPDSSLESVINMDSSEDLEIKSASDISKFLIDSLEEEDISEHINPVQNRIQERLNTRMPGLRSDIENPNLPPSSQGTSTRHKFNTVSVSQNASVEQMKDALDMNRLGVSPKEKSRLSPQMREKIAAYKLTQKDSILNSVSEDYKFNEDEEDDDLIL